MIIGWFGGIAQEARNKNLVATAKINGLWAEGRGERSAESWPKARIASEPNSLSGEAHSGATGSANARKERRPLNLPRQRS